VWNLADNISPRGEANLLSLVDLGNALRGMSKQDQDIHKFQMARILSISRLLESRCQSLFEGLIEAQRWARDEAANKKAARAAKAEMDSLLAEAQESLQKAIAKLESIKRQHQEQCEELKEEKSGLLVGLKDEQTVSTELRHERKGKEATIACLTIEVQTLTSGNRALAEGNEELHEKIAANEAINQVRTEKEAFKQWTISKRSAYLTSSGNRLFSRSAAEELTPVRDQSRRQSSFSGRKGLGSDISMSPRSGATLHRGAVVKQ
jgi:chromosome segregation ATPase